MEKRQLKNLLYEQVARIGKAVSSPKRLELLEILAQGERTVDALATEAGIDVRLASAHLKALREARMVESRRDGRFIAYRLSGPDIASLWVQLREVAEGRLYELRQALDGLFDAAERLDAQSRRTLMDKARRGEVVVIDVRPLDEYLAGHLPYARSLPLAELRQRLAELPAGREVVAYCRGPFCLFAHEAVDLLREHGLAASRIADGPPEWAAAGMPVETGGT